MSNSISVPFLGADEGGLVQGKAVQSTKVKCVRITVSISTEILKWAEELQNRRQIKGLSPFIADLIRRERERSKHPQPIEEYPGLPLTEEITVTRTTITLSPGIFYWAQDLMKERHFEDFSGFVADLIRRSYERLRAWEYRPPQQTGSEPPIPS